MPSSIFADDDDDDNGKPLKEPLGEPMSKPYKPPVKKRKMNFNEKQKMLLKTAEKLSNKIAKTADSLNKVLSQLIPK